MSYLTEIDWARLEKALSIEAQRGYENLKGNQYFFHEFLIVSFSNFSFNTLEDKNHKRTEKMRMNFQIYPQLDRKQREILVSSAKEFLSELKLELEQDKSVLPPIKVRATDYSVTANQSVRNSAIKLQDVLNPVLGVQRTKKLQKLGLFTVKDLLFYYPRDHVDYARQVSISELVAGETVTILGKINACSCFTSPKNKNLTIFDLRVTDRSGKIKLSRFFAGRRYNDRGWQHRYKSFYPVGAIVVASGLVKQNKYGVTLENPEIEVLESRGGRVESIKIGRVLPVYPLVEGITADVVRESVTKVIPALAQIKDPMPEILRDRYVLIGLKEALSNIHFPEARDTLIHARRRLIFDEFFYLQLGFLQRRQKEKENRTTAIFTPTGGLIEEFNQLLPFSLTNAQKRVVNEILGDLQLQTPMNRLVQGDVGSGKTVVAVFAILAAIQSGYQAALMAPTEVLAEQHYRKLINWFSLLHLPVELLTGSTKMTKRREIHSQLMTGELPVLVGTHALIQDPVQFKNLGLVAIDEQHRFGVDQRAALLAKGNSPHILSLTATPIPRTLALTLHGDLDVSQIDELPPGRQAIETKVVTNRDRAKIYTLMRREIEQNRQVYIIFPLVEESEKLDVKAAVEEHQKLSEIVFPEFKIGLLHGRMKSAEKEAALTEFRDNQTPIIVATTVIEVGVDVPNATVMLIENAERFGLSQLHQLRGRVGRGSHQSYCFLLTQKSKQDSLQRLNFLEQSTDGFFLSEMDLRLRGPGQVLGKKQSGLPDFALASLVEDQEILNVARTAAVELIESDPNLENFPDLQAELDLRYQKLLGGNTLT